MIWRRSSSIAVSCRSARRSTISCKSREALAEAHALGIVHRDLKPANLFRDPRTRRLAAREGARLRHLESPRSRYRCARSQLTSTQGLIGSPDYMSPEQVRKPKSVDTRSDIWSLGIILHELLGGAPPFAAETPMSVLAAVVTDAPAMLAKSRPDLPDGLQKVILKCLEKSADRRYQNVTELARALKPYAPLSGGAAVSRADLGDCAFGQGASFAPFCGTAGDR